MFLSALSFGHICIYSFKKAANIVHKGGQGWPYGCSPRQNRTCTSQCIRLTPGENGKLIPLLLDRRDYNPELDGENRLFRFIRALFMTPQFTRKLKKDARIRSPGLASQLCVYIREILPHDNRLYQASTMQRTDIFNFEGLTDILGFPLSYYVSLS